MLPSPRSYEDTTSRERLTTMTTEKRDDPRKGVPGANLDRGKNPVRGVRVDLDLWDSVKVRADRDGTSRNAAIVALLRGYADGTIDLPKD